MAAVMIQVIPSFFTNYSENSLLISANTYEKYIVRKNIELADENVIKEWEFSSMGM